MYILLQNLTNKIFLSTILCILKYKNKPMNEDLIVTLQNYWFSEKEAKIYLTALSLWVAPASTIARNANESRTTVYSILWDLVKKWFFTRVVRENVTYFSAVSPEMLVKIQEQKYKSLQEKLPEFLAVWNALSWHTKIKTFEWKNALKNLFLELATTNVDVKSFQWAIVLKDYPEIYPKEELEIYRSEKIKKWLATYRILSDNRFYQEEETKKDKLWKHKRYTLVLKIHEFDIKSTIHIYWPNKVSFLFFENNYPYVLLVENEFIYNHLKSLFDCIRGVFKLKNRFQNELLWQ